mgnify:CR=1 FL=1
MGIAAQLSDDGSELVIRVGGVNRIPEGRSFAEASVTEPRLDESPHRQRLACRARIDVRAQIRPGGDAVLYVSLLPQFIDPDRGSVALQSLTLGAIQASIAVSGNAVIVLTAGTIAS